MCQEICGEDAYIPIGEPFYIRLVRLPSDVEDGELLAMHNDSFTALELVRIIADFYEEFKNGVCIDDGRNKIIYTWEIYNELFPRPTKEE